MSLGGQTIGFVVVSRGAAGFQGVKSTTRALTLVHGCRFRQLTADETPEGAADIASQTWKATCPPEAAALAAASTGELVYDGTAAPTLPSDRNAATAATVFRIDGPPAHKRDMGGSVNHVTIMAKRQAG